MLTSNDDRSFDFFFKFTDTTDTMKSDVENADRIRLRLRIARLCRHTFDYNNDKMRFIKSRYWK